MCCYPTTLFSWHSGTQWKARLTTQAFQCANSANHGSSRVAWQALVKLLEVRHSSNFTGMVPHSLARFTYFRHRKAYRQDGCPYTHPLHPNNHLVGIQIQKTSSGSSEPSQLNWIHCTSVLPVMRWCGRHKKEESQPSRLSDNQCHSSLGISLWVVR